MKKSIYVLIMALMVGIGAKVEGASYGNGDLTTIISNASESEVIVLTGTAYTYTTRASTLSKSLTIKADPSLTTRPIITVGQAGVQFIYNSSTTSAKTIILDGIAMDGSNIATGVCSATPGSGGNLQVTVNNCYFYNFKAATVWFAYTAATGNTTTPYSDFTVTNSKFIGTPTTQIITNFLTTSSIANTPNNITLRNNVFTNTSATVFLTTVGTTNKVTVDHCTFNACVTSSRKEFAIAATTPCLITNNVFANSVATGNNIVTANASSGNNYVNNAVNTSNTTRYPSASFGSSVSNTPTSFGLETLPVASPAVDASFFTTTPAGLGYYKANTITKSATLSAFNYASGAGPSTAQTFTVGGTDLFNNLTVTAPTDYEVSKDGGTTYASSVVFSPTLGVVANSTVHVRLVIGKSVGSYTGDISLTSTNATTQTIAVSGSVTSGSTPTITLSQASLTGFNYIYNNGPSIEQSFTVSGASLTENIAIAAPTNYEVTTTSGSGFGTSASIPFGSGTLSAVPVYVRLKAGLNSGSYTAENIALTSTGATAQGVTCTGTVTPPTLTITPASLTSFFVLAGSATPSAEKTFTLSGSNLAGNITVTPSTNYEISTTTGGAFAATNPITLTPSSGTVSTTTIYVRLKGSLTTASYNENITVATVGASNSTVACSGLVATPIVKVGTTAGTDLKTSCPAVTYVYGAGPSVNSATNMYISGDYLQSDVTATAPTNFEVSKDNSTYADFVTYTMSGATVTGNLYVRLKAGLNADIYGGNITLTSTSAVNRLVGITGCAVTGGPVIWGTTANVAITAPSAFSYAGAGPSSSSSNLKITCSGLTSAVTVTPSAGFEISTDNTNFQSTAMAVANDGAGNIAAGTIIYTRMAAGLSVGAKTGTITLTATDATTRTVTVSGTVSFSGEISAPATNISSLTLSPSSQITVAADATLTLDQNTNVSSITVAAGGKLSIPTNGTTVGGTITLQSSASGTATLVDDYASPTRTATVQQYLSSARNWYFTPALTGVTVPASSTYFGYEEAGDNVDLSASGSSAYWKPYATGAPLTAGKGYIIQSGGANTLSFTNTTVSGDVSPVLTYNTGKGNGYNLVGNPYPSYLSWSAVYNYDAANGSTANMPTGTIWYRTVNYNGKSVWTGNTSYNLNEIVYNGVRFYKVVAAGTSAATGGPSGSTAGITDGTVTWDYQGSVYVFATVSASGVATPSMVNNLIPPMQAFWVKTAASGGTLRFKNSMRSHNTTGGTNALKAPKNGASDMKIIRLNVSNGASTDEAVIYASANASNAFDSYDAPKYFNSTGSNQAEIYTQVGSEKLVINAMNELNLDTEISLGFATEKANNFTISASEFTNFGSDAKVILKDNQTTTEFDLTAGQSYSFSSAAVNNTTRFSLLFRAPGTTTGIENAEKLNAQVFVNAANQITIIAPEKSNYSIFNALGQLSAEGTINHLPFTINHSKGIYVVKVNNRSTRVVIK